MKNTAKGYLYYPALVLLVLAVPVLIVSIAVNVYARSVELYTGGFARYHITDVTGISNLQLKGVARAMVDYFDGRAGSPQVEVDINGTRRPVYSQKELVHMEDVRKIIDIFKTLEILSLTLFLVAGAYLWIKPGAGHFLKGLQYGAAVTVGLLGSVMLWALIDFNSIFYVFHILSFSNDLWLLDPATDYLIMMFPSGFFFDSAVTIVATVMGVAVVTWVAAYAAGRFILPVAKPG